MSSRSIKTYSDENEWYNSDDGLERLSTWYVAEKEIAFIDYVLKHMPLLDEGIVLEIGGGAGLQGLHWRERLGDRYLHTDYAAPMVAKAQELSLKSQQMDGLNTPFESDTVAGAILIATSTIIWDADMRMRQFEEVRRILKSGGVAVFVASRLAGLQYGFTLQRQDVDALMQMGFELLVFQDWGIIPGSRWSKRSAKLFASLENILARVGLGIRRTIIVRKR